MKRRQCTNKFLSPESEGNKLSKTKSAKLRNILAMSMSARIVSAYLTNSVTTDKEGK